MIGLFDSGRGGKNTLSVLKEALPNTDILLLIDTENAPYGTKTEGEILELSKRNIERLLNLGADTVLIGCCTASTVHPLLSEEYKSRSVPIIMPTALSAMRATKNGKIAVIATERTVSSHAFKSALPSFDVREISAGRLVYLTEHGASDDGMTVSAGEYLRILIETGASHGADTLVLGCTHFHSVESTVKKLSVQYGIKSVVSSAREGALAFARGVLQKSGESGRIIEIKSEKII